MVGVNIGVAAPFEFFPRKKTITSRYFASGQGSGSYFVER